MFDAFTPPEKHNLHNTFIRYLYIISSFIGSLCFVNSLTIGAVFYHLRQKMNGEEKFNEPAVDNSTSRYTPREPYPDLKSMKATKDMRYYALHLDLDLEEHTIITKDGYVLTLHRLIDPKESSELRDLKKPILLQHGLLSCSGAYITSGKNSLSYYFWEQGYDVWLGNNRSWFEARHEFFEGNLMHSEEYWDWDIRELAYFDLPCIIENVLTHKPNHEQLILVGHLQGCTQTFLMLRNGNLSHIHRKIEYFFPLAPAIFPGKLFHERSFIKFIHNRKVLSYKLIFGCCSFLRNLSLARYYLASTSLFGALSYMMFKYLFGWTGKKWGRNKKIWHFHFVFNVTYVSNKLMNWWLSDWVQEGFSNQLQSKEVYDHNLNYAFTPVNSHNEETEEPKQNQQKPHIETKDDSKTYFPYKNHWFDFCKPEDVIPMLMFICDLDYLVDGKRLATHMRHYETGYYQEGYNLDIVELDDYSHLDVVWADDLIGRIGMVIMDKLKEIEKNSNSNSNPIINNEKLSSNHKVSNSIGNYFEPINEPQEAYLHAQPVVG